MKEANQEIEEANEAIAELINSMEQISQASAQTSQIIKIIEGIAFQTNLLALNAGRGGGPCRRIRGRVCSGGGRSQKPRLTFLPKPLKIRLK